MEEEITDGILRIGCWAFPPGNWWFYPLYAVYIGVSIILIAYTYISYSIANDILALPLYLYDPVLFDRMVVVFRIVSWLPLVAFWHLAISLVVDITRGLGS